MLVGALIALLAVSQPFHLPKLPRLPAPKEKVVILSANSELAKLSLSELYKRWMDEKRSYKRKRAGSFNEVDSIRTRECDVEWFARLGKLLIGHLLSQSESEYREFQIEKSECVVEGFTIPAGRNGALVTLMRNPEALLYIRNCLESEEDVAILVMQPLGPDDRPIYPPPVIGVSFARHYQDATCLYDAIFEVSTKRWAEIRRLSLKTNSN